MYNDTTSGISTEQLLLESMKAIQEDVKSIKAVHESYHRDNEIRVKNHEGLAKQVAQLTEEFRESRRDPGKLPSDTTINSQHQQSSSKNIRGIHISAVTNSSI